MQKLGQNREAVRQIARLTGVLLIQRACVEALQPYFLCFP